MHHFVIILGEKKETFSALIEGAHGLVADTITLERTYPLRLVARVSSFVRWIFPLI